jgi:hypothetical protein
MQEYVDDDPGRCFAVLAGPGEKVLVPPGWGHVPDVPDAVDRPDPDGPSPTV